MVKAKKNMILAYMVIPIFLETILESRNIRTFLLFYTFNEQLLYKFIPRISETLHELGHSGTVFITN